MDVQLTADHKLVLFHDEDTRRITGENHRICDLTLEQVKKLNAGHHVQTDSFCQIPELEDVFREFPGAKLLLDIHSPDRAAIDTLLPLIERYGNLNNLIIVSHYDHIVSYLRTKRPGWILGVPKNEARKMVYSSLMGLDFLFPIKQDILMLPEKYGSVKVLSNRVISHARKRNKKIWAWLEEGKVVRTVNSVKEMEHLKALGVKGVFTDAPQALLDDIMLV